MNTNNEIVVGIDVGATSAICIIDKNLNVLFLKSKKEYKISEIIDDIIRFGKPQLISCDVSKIPKKVLKIAKSLGVKVFHPKEDVKEEKKIKLTKNYLYKNWHERDAIFSAIIAMKFLRGKLFKRKEESYKEQTKITDDKENKKLRVNKQVDYKSFISKLIERIKELREENKKLKSQIEKIKNLKNENVKIKYIELKDKSLEIENKALKLVIKILKMNLTKNEMPYVKLEEIDENLLKILKNHINNFVVVSDQVENFYILENIGIEYVVTGKNIDNIWNFKLIFDETEKYSDVGKIDLNYLKNKWKDRILKIINEGNF